MRLWISPLYLRQNLKKIKRISYIPIYIHLKTFLINLESSLPSDFGDIVPVCDMAVSVKFVGLRFFEDFVVSTVDVKIGVSFDGVETVVLVGSVFRLVGSWVVVVT